MLVQSLGYLASALVFSAFYMRTMLPLRWVAIASNVAFIAYGLPLRLWPVVALHCVLLPLNVGRLLQIKRGLRVLRAGRRGNLEVGGLVATLRTERHRSGTVLFRQGEEGECAFVIARGEIELPERKVRLGPGDLFGEIALLSDDRTRTASAICATEVELYRIDGAAIIRAFYQDPGFAMALVRLATNRLVQNLHRLDREPAARSAAVIAPPAAA
ncbi:MAG TPA: cyclic nucleotide-binding domain-containing protein [Acetobacteraceae bacterium]|nr:cyclic nucleotide-binding domain-containing protein [Acetobacteraceae bacterium]